MNQKSVCDEQVYNELYVSKAQEIRNFLYYKCGDASKAEDLTQDTFLKLWNKCKEVLYEGVIGFLFTMANNLFLDHIKAKKVALKFEKSLVITSNEQDPYYHLRTKEFQNQLESTISNFPEGQREAFLLNRIDKLTFKEIAQRLRISETAVENRMSKALEKLRGQIKEFKQQGI